MAAAAVQIRAEQLPSGPRCAVVEEQGQMQSAGEDGEKGYKNHGSVCAICLDKIVLQETALVKGCEHAYCVMCILQWATYGRSPTCPQCKSPFETLNVHRSLDGSIYDYMFEESVCLLLRATWFKPTLVEYQEEQHDELEGFYINEEYEGDDDDDDDLDDYYNCSSSIRIGNRRWGDNGFVRAGRQEARPVLRANIHDSGTSSSSRDSSKKETVKSTAGRRAKRAMKREAANKAAAAKHQEHLARFGRD